MNSIKIPQPPKKKTAGQQFKEDLIYWILIVAIFYVLSLLFKAITAPFRALLSSPKEKFEQELKIKREKVQNRIGRRVLNGINENFITNQYIERFKLHPEKYVGDPDNEIIAKWHEAFLNGTLLDSELQWAPVVYVEDYEKNNYPNDEFLDYLQRQVDLHKQDTFLSRYKLTNTIRNLFPEFTPNLNVIPSEIKEMRERGKSKRLRMELMDEVIKKGISKELAVELVNSSEKDPKALPKKIALTKKCLELGYSNSMCRYCMKTDYDPTDVYAEAVDVMVKTFDSGDEMASALIRGDIDVEEFDKIVKENTNRWNDSNSICKGVEEAFYQLIRRKAMSHKKG
jgi:hypothetical protein